MYASVLRLSDTTNLRIKDLNFADEQIEIASTKHDHFRIVPFPRPIHDAVKRQIDMADLIGICRRRSVGKAASCFRRVATVTFRRRASVEIVGELVEARERAWYR